MADWVGFTEEELRRLKREQYGNEVHVHEEKPAETVKKVGLTGGARRTRPREKIRKKNSSTAVTQNIQESSLGRESDVPRSRQKIEQKILNSAKTEPDRELSERENSSPECERTVSGANKKGSIEEETSRDVQDDLHAIDTSKHEPEMILEPERIQAIELSALQKMQQRQKEIEEQNKKKKAVLQKAIKQRYKKTQAEAHVLNAVQKELGHLDTLLSADVAILRDTIEEASREYHYAQKRYERAEAEFVEAKIDLHRKTERKELLTEHLYTIIQENEQRKALKLEDLMVKLNVSEEFIQNSNLCSHGENLVESAGPQEEKTVPQNIATSQQLTEAPTNVCDDKGVLVKEEPYIKITFVEGKQQQKQQENLGTSLSQTS